MAGKAKAKTRVKSKTVYTYLTANVLGRVQAIAEVERRSVANTISILIEESLIEREKKNQ